MSEATIGGLVILAVLGLVIAWALVRGGARCDGYTDDPDDWRADGARDVVVADDVSDVSVLDRALSDAELQAMSAGDNPQWLPKEGRA